MGAVNIFLGGTGKHIAEDIQDSKDFFGLTISEPIVFDLAGFVRQGVALPGFVHPEQAIANDVSTVATKWTGRDPGPAIGPNENSIVPGPDIPPENSVLVAIGGGIAANPKPAVGLFALRAHGLTVFSALFDHAMTIAGAGDGPKLQKLIGDAITQQAKAFGEDPRINLITSTAGGTGAGTVIPLALWIRENYPRSPRTLVAVTPDAFSTVLKGAPALKALKYKGLSGTYAMLRELSFFEGVDPQARFLSRRLHVASNGLQYAPGDKLFNRIYWFGGRDAARPSDAFEEAGALVRILSTDGSAQSLDENVGAHPLQNVGSITAIEYPKLRLQRKMVSQVLTDFYEHLRAPAKLPGGAAPLNTPLLDYVNANVGRKIGAWFHAQRAGVFAPIPSASLREEDCRGLIAGIHAEAGVDTYDGISRGPQYDASSQEWSKYVTGITTEMDKVAEQNQGRLSKAIPRMREEEEGAFADWLREKAFGAAGWLSGDSDGNHPYGIADVRDMLGQLDTEARSLQTRVSGAKFIPGPTVPDLETKIKGLTNRLAKPLSGNDRTPRGLSWSQRGLGLAAAAAVVLIGGLLLQPLWNSISRFGEFGGTAASELLVWIGVILGAALAYRLVTRGFFLRSHKDISTLRQEAETDLFEAYRERDRIRAIRWLHEELCGDHEKPAFFRELRDQVESVAAFVNDLDKVYAGLGAKAKAAVAAAATAPPFVHATVGDCIPLNAKLAKKITPEIALRLRVEATFSPNHRVRALEMRLRALDGDDGRFTPVGADARSILDALNPDLGIQKDAVIGAAKSWDDALWELVNWKLGETLPPTFDKALTYCANDDDEAATRALVAHLNTLKLPRTPSTALPGGVVAPVYRRLYAGDIDILARFNAALADPALAPAVSSDLASYGEGQVVGSLGEQIVFLDIWADSEGQSWAPHVISNALVAKDALKTYYGVTGAEPETTAVGTCFTVLPELLAATRIELGGQVVPLAPVVIARLLGSDFAFQGPTYAEMFYLLRSRGHLRFERRGAGPEAKTVVEIDLDGDNLRIVELPPGTVPDERFFGDGRGRVVAFDAFCDFMRFDGKPKIADGAARASYDGTTLLDSDWAADPRRVARLQRAIVLQWYKGDIEADCEAMLRVLKEDVDMMNAGGDEGRAARESWERAMRRLIAGEERRQIRRTLISGT